MTDGHKPLADRLREEIHRNGPIRVDTYMAACLADPMSGYYANHDPFGTNGDFITAPETSQTFGELIGLWAVTVWKSIGEPNPVHLVELGPGRGTLLSDALRAMKVAPEMLAATYCHLVEISPLLCEMQQRTLQNAPCPITWHTDLAQIEPGPTILIANEFFDALPIRQFVKRGDNWFERLITLNGEQGFQFTLSANPISDFPTQVPYNNADAAPDGNDAIIETCSTAQDLITLLGARAALSPLAALVIDYGHIESSIGETLQAVRSHQFVDPLQTPGKADLTAHVNFASLLAAAGQANLAPYGPITQAHFLLALGLAKRVERLITGATEEQAQALVSGAQRLIDPDQMGELFKVVSFTSQGVPPPAPFGADT